MLLVVDIGNTLTDLGVYVGEKLVSTFKTESSTSKSLDEYQSVLALYMESKKISASGIEAAIVSSVVPTLTRIWVPLIENIFKVKPLTVGPRLKTGLLLKVDHPQEVGSDLVADSVGGVSRYGNSLFIADLGTANKAIFIDKDGAYAGLVISPGLIVSQQALVARTASLPEVSLIAPTKVIGKNTADCMNSGITYGTAFQIRGLAAAFEKEVGYPLKRILTGGNAVYVKNILDDFVYDEHLLFEGLRVIDSRNR
jgi:type III pantothenate kinase